MMLDNKTQYEISGNIALGDVAELQEHGIALRGANKRYFAYSPNRDDLNPSQKKVLDNLIKKLEER